MAATVALTEVAPASSPRISRAPLLIVGLSLAWIVMVVIFGLFALGAAAVAAPVAKRHNHHDGKQLLGDTHGKR